MNDVQVMQQLLEKLQVPIEQRSELCAYTLLAMAGIKRNTSWIKATNEWIRMSNVAFK